MSLTKNEVVKMAREAYCSGLNKGAGENIYKVSDLVMSIGEHEKCTDERMCIACFSGQGKCENPTPPQPAAQEPVAFPMESAPRDSTLVRLLVNFEANSLEDSPDPVWTIGANCFDNDGIDEWKFAGWDWSQDCFAEGAGKPIGWLQMLSATPPSAVPVVRQMVVELPAPTARFNWNLGKFEWLVTFKHSEHHLKPLYSHDQLLQYGAAQRLAGQQRGTCTWTEQDDEFMPGTYASSCGEMWSFTDGGVKENRVTYCHHCGGKVVPASPQEQI